MVEQARCKFCGTREGSDPADPLHVVEMAHSWTFLDSNQSYRGHAIVVAKGHVEDLTAFPPPVGVALYEEMVRIAAAIRRAMAADHMNYLALGNVVRHVHWHVYPRYRSDPKWGGAPIPDPPADRLPDADYRAIAQAIRRELG